MTSMEWPKEERRWLRFSKANIGALEMLLCAKKPLFIAGTLSMVVGGRKLNPNYKSEFHTYETIAVVIPPLITENARDGQEIRSFADCV